MWDILTIYGISQRVTRNDLFQDEITEARHTTTEGKVLPGTPSPGEWGPLCVFTIIVGQLHDAWAWSAHVQRC